VPLCVLHLPTLITRASIVRLGYRAEPNPVGSSPLAIPAPSSWPFRDKADDAIILFNVLIEDVHLEAGPHHFPETRPFTFVVHRGALLAHIPVAQRAYPPFCSAPEPAPPARAGSLGRVGSRCDAVARERPRIDTLDNDDGRSARCHDGGWRSDANRNAGL
jgi:hypothetical protein